MRDALARIDSGRDPFPQTMTVNELAKAWLVHKTTGAGRRARPLTLARYESMLNGHILPSIGRVSLGGVRPAHIQALLDACMAKNLAPRTVQHIRNVCRGMFKFAVAQGLLEINPVVSTEVPTVAPRDYVVLTAADLRQLIEAAKGTRWEIPMLIACTVGTRRSETLGVRWASVDLASADLWINESVQRVEGVIQFTEVKTHRSRRAVPLPAVTVERLRRWRVEQAERRLALGSDWHDLDLVCERGDGYFHDPHGFSAAFKRFCAKLGISPKARLHDARHGVGTALALATNGDAVVVRDTLGHSKTAFTLDTYVHATFESAAKARVALDAAFGLPPQG